MKMLIKVTVAVIVIAAFLGLGTQVGHQRGAIGVLPGQAGASTLCCADGCTAYASAPYKNAGGYYTAQGYIAGCGSRTIQVCDQTTDGRTWGCRTMTAQVGTSWYFSNPVYTGRITRTWFWVSGKGTYVSGYV